jgi:hypothetical protein
MIAIDAGYAMGLSKIYKSSPPVRKEPKTLPSGQPDPAAGTPLIDNSSASSSDFRVAVGFMMGL